jgi:predicted P-loop ATPase
MTNVHPFAPARPNWWNLLVMGERGPLSNYANAYIAISRDPFTSGAIGYDEMLRMPTLLHRIGGLTVLKLDNNYPRPVTDKDIGDIQKWVQESGLKSMSYDNVHRAVFNYAEEHKYHPVLDYLDGLSWDEEGRLDIWLAKYLGAPSSPYSAAIGKMFLIAMVARVYDPGCKADYMLVLEGPQGEQKSSALRILGEPWFSDNLPDISAQPKDAATHLRGKWLLEIPEMHAFNKAETTHLKSFVSRQEERFRPPYGRAEVIEQRQCVFAGTTNKDLYLKDETGGRRFWPVKCGSIHLDALREDRNQLFAEAVWLLHHDADWFPSREFEREFIAPQQEARYDGDTWEDLIREFTASKTVPITLKEIAIGCLGFEDPNTLFSGGSSKIPYTRFGTSEQNRAKRALAAIGWERIGRQGGTGVTLFGRRVKQ